MDKRFNKVVIWGYPLGTHTHSFIHYSFHKAFSYMGYETYWMNDDHVINIDFSKTLFIAAGEQEKNIPLREDCYYVLHNVDCKKYLENACKILILQVHTKNRSEIKHGDFILNNYTHLSKGEVDVLYTCWATDLLPHEINIGFARNEVNNRECVWIGTFGDSTGMFQNGTELDPFFKLCERNKIRVNKINPWSKYVSFDENRQLVNTSFIAPTIQGPWQINNEYLPCRIFKHISYGHMGYTNSPSVNNIFNGELIFSRDIVDLFHKSLEFKSDHAHIEKLKYLMNEVKEKHTYLNRIETILKYLP